MAQTKIKAGLFEGIIGNGTDGYFLMSNGDGTMTWSSVVINPTITDVDYPGTATAADPAGGETITLTGTGFKTGATVTVGGTSAPSVSYVSETQITFTTPAKTAGDYDIVVTNTDTGSATFINGISFNGIPAWTTAAGSLGTFASNTTISTITLQATEPDAGTITFNITNGALPTGLSLTGANIDGTTSILNADTLYTFTVTATDDENQATPRTFTITVQKEFISSENFTINTYTGNGSTQSIEGKIGTAAEFNGVNPNGSVIDLPGLKSFFTQKQTFSLSMWFNTEGVSTDNSYLFSDYNSSSYNIFAYITTAGLLKVSNRMNGTTNTFTSSSAYDDSQWYHLVVTNDATSRVVTVYINGSSIGTTNISANSWSTGSLGKLGIGAFYSTTNSRWQQSLKGKIDQVRIFDKVLSSSEVTTLYGESNTSTTKSTTDIFADGSGVALYEFEKGAIDTGGTNGYIGSAGVFNGSSSYIEVPSFSFGSDNIAVSMWVNPESTQTAYSNLFDFDHSSGTVGTFSIQQDNTNTNQYKINQWNGSSYNVSTAVTLSANQWNHLVFSLQSNGSYVIYLNGSSSVTGSNLTASTSAATETLNIGRWLSTGTPGRYFNGKLDQIRIFNKALSSSEVTTLYGETSASATKSTTDIFDDGSGIALYELEGNALDTGGASGKFGSAAIFNGSSSYITLGTGVVPVSSDYSITMWVYRNSGSGRDVLLSQYQSSQDNRNTIEIDDTTSKISFNNDDVTLRTSTYTVPFNEWVHLAFTLENTTDDFKIYANGVEQTTQVDSGTADYTMKNYTTQLGTYNNLQDSRILDGKIDELRIYSDVLTSDEVGYIYNNTTASIPTDNLQNHYKFDGNAEDEQGNNNPTTVNDIIYEYNGTATNVTYAYDGTPTNVSFVGTSFQPDLVWIKERGTAQGHRWYDSVRGETKHLNSENNAIEATNTGGLTSFDTNGFSLGSYAPVNENNATYAAWCFKGGGPDVLNENGSINSQVSANQDAGFSIVKWTAGSDNNATIGHGLSQAPEIVIYKILSTTGSWHLNTTAIDGSYDRLSLNTTSAKIDVSSGQEFTSTTFKQWSYSSGDELISYCFHSVDGYQKIGSYTGTGATGNVINVGFKPRFLMWKKTNGAVGWFLLDGVRNTTDVWSARLEAHNANAEAGPDSYTVTVSDTGFEMTGSFATWTGSNELNSTYIYLVIA